MSRHPGLVVAACLACAGLAAFLVLGPCRTRPTSGPAEPDQSLSTARAEVQVTLSKSNLHIIGIGIAIWRAGHSDQYPPSLEDLKDPAYLEDTDVLLDPADDNPRTLGEQGLVISYEYPGSVPKNGPANLITCYSRQGIHAGGRVALYEDIWVQWVSEADLHRPGGGRGMSLRECYGWIMAHGGAELPPEQQARLRAFYEVQ